MFLADLAIKRPVMMSMLLLAFLLFGLIAEVRQRVTFFNNQSKKRNDNSVLLIPSATR